jgi:hypothetical protein
MLDVLVVPGMPFVLLVVDVLLVLLELFVLGMLTALFVLGMLVVLVLLGALIGLSIADIMLGDPGMTIEWWTWRHQTYASTCGAPLSSPSTRPSSCVHTRYRFEFSNVQYTRPAALSSVICPEVKSLMGYMLGCLKSWFQPISPLVMVSVQLPKFARNGPWAIWLTRASYAEYSAFSDG